MGEFRKEKIWRHRLSKCIPTTEVVGKHKMKSKMGQIHTIKEYPKKKGIY